MGLGIFKDPSLLGMYHGAPPLLQPANQVCVISSNGTHTEDARPPQEASVIPDVPIVAEPLSPEPPVPSSTPTVHESTSPQGHSPVWETVPQPLTQIPFFYPPPGIEAFQVATTLTLPNMVLALPVWYLHPPAIVPQTSLPQTEGIPMTIPILTPTIPSTPPITNPLAIAGGRRKKTEPIAPLPPCIPSPLATIASPVVTSPNSSNKGPRTKFVCAICSNYGHYTHHCPSIPYVRHTLAAARHTSRLEFPPTLHNNAPANVIYYTSSSILEQMGSTCPPPKLPPDRP